MAKKIEKLRCAECCRLIDVKGKVGLNIKTEKVYCINCINKQIGKGIVVRNGDK